MLVHRHEPLLPDHTLTEFSFDLAIRGGMFARTRPPEFALTCAFSSAAEIVQQEGLYEAIY
jgi:hypothetical protein